MAARTLINVPAKAKRGEVIAIKSLISHIMENGFRHDNMGKPILSAEQIEDVVAYLATLRD